MIDLIPSRRALRVWQRNATTYRRVWVGNLIGHLADPLFYLAVLGFGLGSMMPPVDGLPYVTFLVTGLLAGAAMSSACFEASYSSFLRMSGQGTFDAMLATPLSVADIAGGEILWAATKGGISAVATALVGIGFGLIEPGWWMVPILPVLLLQGIFFAGASLAVAARVPTLEGLNHFYALFIMPLLFLSGVFFPLERMPPALGAAAQLNPLTHVVHLVRPLAAGATPAGWALELVWLLLAALVGTLLGASSLRRRMVL